MAQCPECGADWPEGRTCQSIFDEFLVWEFQDPEYGAVHFLTVAAFMTQHGRYTDEGQTWIKQKLHENLEANRPVDLIRRMANRETSQANRKWKVVREPGAPPAKRIAWDMTIVDVNRRHDQAGLDAAAYREAVVQWARTTLRQLEEQ